MSNLNEYFGFINKKSKYRKQFKRRFFEIKDGLIKYYTTCSDSNYNVGSGLRGIYDLTGVKVLPISNEFPLRINLVTPQDRKNEISLEAENENDLKNIISAIQNGITIKNTIALSNASRLPEIVDWYYQCQGVFLEQMKILETEHKFQLQYQISQYGNSTNNSNTPSRSTSTNSAITTLATPPSTLSSYGSTVLSNSQSPSNQTQLSSTNSHSNSSYLNSTGNTQLSSNVSIQAISTIVKIIANKDHSGLLFRVEIPTNQNKTGKKLPMTKLEALTDGRVLLFRDIERIYKCRPEDYYPSLDQGRDRGISNGSEVGNVIGETDDRSNSIYSSTSTVNNNIQSPTYSNSNSQSQSQSNLNDNQPEKYIHKDEYDICICTKEDTLHLRRYNPQNTFPSTSELNEFHNWYNALHGAVSFGAITPPSSTLRNLNQINHSSTPYNPNYDYGGNNNNYNNNNNNNNYNNCNNNTTTRNSSSSAAVHYGFYSMNSGLIFSCAGDVAVIIKTFDRLQKMYPSIGHFSNILTEIFKLIPDVRTNKETVSNFGERLEDIVRVLGDQNNGVFWMNHSPSENVLINEQIVLLTDYLVDFKSYLLPLTNIGWMNVILTNQNISKIFKYPRLKTLQEKMSTKKKVNTTTTTTNVSSSVISSTSTSTSSSTKILSPSKLAVTSSSSLQMTSTEKCIFRQIFETIDSNLIHICNKLLKEYGDETWIFKKKDYDMVVDIKQTIEALGGFEIIYSEQAKIKALGRLIQSNNTDVENELQILVDLKNNPRSSFQSNNSGISRYLCCCIPILSSQNNKSNNVNKNNNYNNNSNNDSLKESLLSNEENQDNNYNKPCRLLTTQTTGSSGHSVSWGDEILINETKDRDVSSSSPDNHIVVEEDFKGREVSVVSTDGVALRPMFNQS